LERFAPQSATTVFDAVSTRRKLNQLFGTK
jgi:hypothetical protein